jgi:5-methylcytosine-specific restriction endonuclease McrA
MIRPAEEEWKGRGRWYRMARREVAGRDGPGCRACGIEGVRLDLDHITPRSMGGPKWALENLQLLCGICHRAKSAREARGRRRGIRDVVTTAAHIGGTLRPSRRW